MPDFRTKNSDHWKNYISIGNALTLNLCISFVSNQSLIKAIKSSDPQMKWWIKTNLTDPIFERDISRTTLKMHIHSNLMSIKFILIFFIWFYS